ncbi:hypothetical protein BDY21DRAFT_366508 [Lineolata rhizophorae]|uniref:Copper acquisition factor BIM1-like domain-containing protein n=1 Tax=Lineolata rhizophorae TaxID=578093 RepID=A0A6A6NQM5_9PEZI|nr:hypothetical protein BDY21DRAFT_366508 [Lineolata rhizophorae]
MFRRLDQSLIVLLGLVSSLATAHTVITYPGWRGDNLVNNGTLENGEIPTGALGINYENGSYTFPFGMQWMYPCGGMPTSTNRTRWPVRGGAVSVQPGWFAGHKNAFFYINLGLGTEPLNYSLPMLPVFQIIGPSNEMYAGEFCLPQVPLPENVEVNVGDNATIQIIETAQHGAALYNCVDITFAEPEDVAEVTEENCHNSTDAGKEIDFSLVFATTSLESAAPALSIGMSVAMLPVIAAVMFGFLA